jgi:hypothetical protein
LRRPCRWSPGRCPARRSCQQRGNPRRPGKGRDGSVRTRSARPPDTRSQVLIAESYLGTTPRRG